MDSNFVLMQISTFMPHFSLSSGSMNTLLEVDIDTTNVANPLVQCQFEPGFTCTIDYGIDPLYTNLTGRETTSTLGRVTTHYLLPGPHRRHHLLLHCVCREYLPVCETFRTGGWIHSGGSWQRLYAKPSAVFAYTSLVFLAHIPL